MGNGLRLRRKGAGHWKRDTKVRTADPVSEATSGRRHGKKRGSFGKTNTAKTIVLKQLATFM